MKKIFEEKAFLKSKGLHGYKPHLSLYIEKDSYIIKLVETEEELIKIFSLRYEVYGKYSQKPFLLPLDVDDYDKSADHIIVINKGENKVVGAYRVLCSDYTSNFFTASKFNIDSVKKLNQRFVEMGRATVSEKSRSGVVIALLWRGLGEYIKKIKADYLFGSATLWTQDFNEVANIWKYFEQKRLFCSEKIFPLEINKIPAWDTLLESKLLALSEEELKQVSKKLPPLFKSYIKAGARFGATPANDVMFESVDFFTICKVSELSKGLIKKYL